MSVQQLLKDRASQAFDGRGSLISLWQEIADNFYPERADFSSIRMPGSTFASNLQSSYPIIVRRDLGNYFSSVLRPRNEEWATVSTDREDKQDQAARVWLERASAIQRRAMYDPIANFVRATKEGDHDFAAFGQCVLSIEHNARHNTLLYRCWHLRDVAWTEDETGAVGDVFARWTPTIQQLRARWKDDKLHRAVIEKGATNAYATINCMRIVMRSEEYEACGGKKYVQPWVSIYFDMDNNHEIEVVGSWTRIFRIPRWQTVSGSQYAYSPATVAGLPDARLLQSMTLTLLEAGESAVRPPLLAKKELTVGELNNYAGGVTIIDAEYDERLGDVIRPLFQDKSGLPYGMEISRDVREMLVQAFFLNKLSLPPPDKAMTAYEVSQRIKEFIQATLPLFEPMEMEYNAGLCDDSFEILMRNGAFGPTADIPRSIAGQNTRFKFKSPFYEAVEAQKGTKLREASEMLANAAALDPSAGAVLDVRVALRDALTGVGAPATWLRSEDAVERYAQEQADAAAQRVQLEAASGAADVAERAGKAQTALATA